jgi:hypothetical protein
LAWRGRFATEGKFRYLIIANHFELEVKKYIPHLALQKYVLNISTVHVVLPEGISDVVTPYPPTPFQASGVDDG